MTEKKFSFLEEEDNNANVDDTIDFGDMTLDTDVDLETGLFYEF